MPIIMALNMLGSKPFWRRYTWPWATRKLPNVTKGANEITIKAIPKSYVARLMGDYRSGKGLKVAWDSAMEL